MLAHSCWGYTKEALGLTVVASGKGVTLGASGMVTAWRRRPPSSLPVGSNPE